MNDLTREQQRWLAVGLLLTVVLVAVTLLFVPWYMKISEYNDAIDKMEFRLERFAEKITDREKVVEAVETIKGQIKALGIFNAGSTEALALAEMQQKVKDAVAASEGNLMSTQTLEQQKADSLTKIIVRVRFAGRVETLKNVLYELETAQPYMLVENLQITSVRGMRNPKTRKIEPVDKVNVMMDVVSFMQAKAK
ncbi:MAG: type II secretion system protein GspM [Gammaproteobacteria bacterium]